MEVKNKPKVVEFWQRKDQEVSLKSLFRTLKKINSGKVRFDGSSSVEVDGIGTLLSNGETKVENVLYVKGLTEVFKCQAAL